MIYDGYPGGVGIAELGFAAGRRHLAATLAVIERCPCRRGCPSCVQSPKCGNGNEPLDKAGAVGLSRHARLTQPRSASRDAARRAASGVTAPPAWWRSRVTVTSPSNGPTSGTSVGDR